MSGGTGNQSSFVTTWSRWFLLALILAVLYLAYRLVEPFLMPIFLAVVLVVVASPLYQYLLELLGGHRALASGLTCVLLIALFAVPFFFIVSMITSQALDLYTTVTHLLTSDQLHESLARGLGRLRPLLDELQDKLGISHADVVQHVGEWVRRISNLLYANFTMLLKGATNLVIGFALMVFVTFYLFMDGREMAARIMSLSPLPVETNQRILEDILRTLRATLRGSVVLALINGTASGLGFWVFGVPNALFWGTVMVFASVVPIVGTGLVWVPAGVYLLLMGHLGAGVGVMVWCLVVSLACDNWLRPQLIGGQAHLHPLLTFFAVLGGLSLFGLVGLILGPLVLALLLSLTEVYQRYFLEPAEPSLPQAPAVAPTDEAAATVEENEHV